MGKQGDVTGGTVAALAVSYSARNIQTMSEPTKGVSRDCSKKKNTHLEKHE